MAKRKFQIDQLIINSPYGEPSEYWRYDREVRMFERKKKVGTGRLDVFVSEEGSGVRAIVDIKHSDWDRMTPRAVRRNVKRQARQIWKYIELQPTLDGICPGIVFPKRASRGRCSAPK